MTTIIGGGDDDEIDNLTHDDMNNIDYLSQQQQQHQNHQRHKRQSTSPLNRCPMKLVADYRFYRNIAKQVDAVAVKYLVG